jgi:hypothetical protein
VDAIHDAFMASSVHRAGILGNYEKVGIGTTWKDGTLWVTEVFFRAKKTSTTTTTTTTTTRRTSTIRRQSVPPVRRVVVRTAAATRPVPVAPPKPAAVQISLPAMSSGKIEKLLGDLQIAGDSLDPDGLSASPAPEVAATPDTKLAAVLWEFVEASS